MVFPQLRERLQEYLEKVAAITGCDAQQIAEAARLFATAGPSVILGPILDMQVNSTSGIRCEDLLVSICGFVGKCEQLQSPNLRWSMCHSWNCMKCFPGTKGKTVRSGSLSAALYRGYEPLRAAVKRVYGIEWLDLEASFMANPAAVFRAMRTDQHPRARC